jgi:hypothetical protein
MAIITHKLRNTKINTLPMINPTKRAGLPSKLGLNMLTDPIIEIRNPINK